MTTAAFGANGPSYVEKSLAILKDAMREADGPVALACSFSAEDVVVIDLMLASSTSACIFALDTGRLGEQTYLAAEAVRTHFGIEVEWYFPKREEVEKLERGKGLFSFRESLEERKECCHIRKVEPLKRALAGLGGWITGLRAEQSATRGDLDGIERDSANGGIVKINPLAHWSSSEVWDYIHERGLPINKLYKEGYTSIGCAPCTRAVKAGEHERAGRWWWESPEHKECGLHNCGGDRK